MLFKSFDNKNIHFDFGWWTLSILDNGEIAAWKNNPHNAPTANWLILPMSKFCVKNTTELSKLLKWANSASESQINEYHLEEMFNQWRLK